ncbi:hypothetical protein ACFE04_030909 [Oxalis oulophora]
MYVHLPWNPSVTLNEYSNIPCSYASLRHFIFPPLFHFLIDEHVRHTFDYLRPCQGWILGQTGNPDPATGGVYVYPTMSIALFCAFSLIKYDLKKVTRKAPPEPIEKPLPRSAKSKLK